MQICVIQYAKPLALKRHKWFTHTQTHTHTHKPVYEEGDVTVLWNQTVHTDREVTENRYQIQ